jgi:hypothetical protein
MREVTDSHAICGKFNARFFEFQEDGNNRRAGRFLHGYDEKLS